MPRLRLKEPLKFAHDGHRVVAYPAGEIETSDPELVRCAIADHGAELVVDEEPAAPPAEDPPKDPTAPPAKKATKRTRRKSAKKATKPSS